jgi:hypothetical protein
MEYLDQLDQLVLMAKGRVVFTGTEAQMLAHFKAPHAAAVFGILRGLS